jgi:hypothetical protein
MSTFDSNKECGEDRREKLSKQYSTKSRGGVRITNLTIGTANSSFAGSGCGKSTC